MSLTSEVKVLRFLSLGLNTGDIITLQSSVSVKLCLVLFGLVVSVLSTSITGECGESFVSGLWYGMVFQCSEFYEHTLEFRVICNQSF